jgi:hypothetical protein
LAVAGALAVLIGGAGVAQEKQPITVQNKQLGLAISRPNDEKWKCQESGRWYNTCIGVTHVIDDLTVDAVASFLEPNTKWPDGGVEAIGKDVLQNYRDNTKPESKDKPARWKEFKVITEEKKSKYPGAGGPTAFYVQAHVTLGDDSVKELNEWVFLKSNNLYRVAVVGGKGEYKKKIKDVGFILGSLQISKPDKK